MGRSEAPSVENNHIQNQSSLQSESHSVNQAGNLSASLDQSIFYPYQSSIQSSLPSQILEQQSGVDLALNLLISSEPKNDLQSKRKHLDTTVTVRNSSGEHSWLTNHSPKPEDIRKSRSMSLGSLSHLNNKVKCAENSQADHPKRFLRGLNCKVSNRDSKKSENMKEMLKYAISKESRQQIEKLVGQVENFTDLEKLFLYLNLPVRQTADGDPLKQNINPLGSRFEIGQTKIWIQTHLQEDPDVSLPKHEVYDDYLSYCTHNNMKPLSTADFGKVMKQVYPLVKPRRLGMRGKSRYCYAGLRKKANLKAPNLPFLGEIECVCEDKISDNDSEVMGAAHALVQEWAEKMLGLSFKNIIDLAFYLVNKTVVGQGSVAAFTLLSSVQDRQDTVHGNLMQEASKDVLKDSNLIMKQPEPQRPCPNMLDQVSINRSTNEGDDLCDLSQVKCEREESCCPSLSTVISPCTNSTTPVVSPLSIQNNNLCLSSTAMVTVSSQPTIPSVPSLALVSSTPEPKMNKLPIPRINCKKSLANIIILPPKPSPPVTSKLTSKSKYKPIQPKPIPFTTEHLPAPVKAFTDSLTYVKRSRHVDWNDNTCKDTKNKTKMQCLSTFPVSAIGISSGIGSEVDKKDADLMSEYLAESSSQDSDANDLVESRKNSFSDVSGTDDNGKTKMINEIRLILEQKLQRLPNLQIEEPQPGQMIDNNPLCVVGLINENEGGTNCVQGINRQNTPRRRVSFYSEVDIDKLPPLQETPASKVESFQFTPITQNNVNLINNCNSHPSQPSSASQSPFVSPRTTPISNTRSRHSSGQSNGYVLHMTPIADTSNSGSSSNSPFLSPLNTPVPCTRSRHSSLQNSRVAPYSVHGNSLSRKRNSSGGLSLTLNSLPPPKGNVDSKPCEGDSEPFFLQPDIKTRGPRSRHSSGNVPSPLSAPHSPTLLPGDPPEPQNSMLQKLLRTNQFVNSNYDPRRRHSSCVDKIQHSCLKSDLLSQEIATIFHQSDSCGNKSTFIDSTELRSRSVPLSQMTANDLLNYSHSHPTTPLISHPFEFPLHESRSNQSVCQNDSLAAIDPPCEILPSVFDDRSVESMSVCEFSREDVRDDSYLHIEPSQDRGADLSNDLTPFNGNDPSEDLSSSDLPPDIKVSLGSYDNHGSLSNSISRSHPSTPVTGFDSNKVEETCNGTSKSYPSTPITYDDHLIGSNQITLNALNNPEFARVTHVYSAKKNISQLWDVSPGDNDDPMFYDYDEIAKLLDENDN